MAGTFELPLQQQLPYLQLLPQLLPRQLPQLPKAVSAAVLLLFCVQQHLGCGPMIVVAEATFTPRLCSEAYSDYFNQLGPGEINIICQLMQRVVVDDGGATHHNKLRMPAPSPGQLRTLVHVDTDADELRRQAELRRAERQERLIKERDRNNSVLRLILDRFSSAGQHSHRRLPGYVEPSEILRQEYRF